MEANELTYGSWVMVDNPSLGINNRMGRIIGIEPREGSARPTTFTISFKDDNNEICHYVGCSKRNVHPIDISPDILFHNGFVNDFYEDETIADNGAAITFQGYSYHDDGILVTYCNETIHATNDYTDAYITIRGTSVSLLQHVMRLCGIKKEIII